MAKNYSKRNRTKKSLIAMLCALSVTCTGLAAACANDNGEDEVSNAVTAREDNQLLKNGNFEHFDIPDKAVHLIKNVNNWSLGGDTSVKSGVINVANGGWDELTDDGLADKLDYNNDLSSSNEEYVNYNSMRSRDLLYKDNYAATLAADASNKDQWINQQGYMEYFGITGEEGDYKIHAGTAEEKKVYKNADDDEFYFDEDFTQSVRKELISNPKTHYKLNEEETKVTVDGKEYDVKTEEKTGTYYYTDGDGKDNYISNVLMLHNSPTNAQFNGVNQYYTSSSITLEANTSAEISFWVKTSDLKFDKGYSTLDQQDKGAYVEVIQTVASTTIDNFAIKAINTEKIIKNAAANSLEGVESNGWLKYTVYVNACDFSSSTVQLRLGLGGNDNDEKVTGYAFFDDVQVTKYRSLDDESCTYTANAAKIESDKTSCNLTTEAEDKIFYADEQTRGTNDGKHRTPDDFHYLIDLASEQGAGKTYNPVVFGNNVEAGLTTEKDSKNKVYAATEEIATGVIKGVGTKNVSAKPNLVKDAQALPTDSDFIGTNLDDFANTNYAKVLKDAAKNINKLPAKDGGNILAMFSAWGVPYTATVSDTTFKVNNEGYAIVSLWVKTSDMDGGTAATLKIYEEDEKNEPVEESVQTITIDTTGTTVKFGNDKDIYDGWVQCFFFVKNDTKAEKTFKIDFSFGTTSIINAGGSYDGGWAMIANMQTLEIDEEIYNLASSNSTTALFSFYNEDDDTTGNVMADASGTSDIKTGIAVPDDEQYTGKNGASSSVANVENRPSYNASNSHPLAGLINRDDAESYAVWSKIAGSFATANSKWNEVFGENCYQPLIIVNQLRHYAEKAEATEETFDNGNYYVEVADDAEGTGIVTTVKGKKYRQVVAGDEYKADETYYKLSDVVNYGYIGAEKSVSANNTETISVRVKVSEGAVAYVYLVDTTDTKKVISYTTPAYTFHYDEEGNVLDEEFDEDWKDNLETYRKHIIYTLRDDGLYDGKDGKVYANTHNLVKTYDDSKYEHVDLYDKNGTKADPDNLEKDVDYYLDKEATQHADYYLTTSDGTNVYEVKDGKYFYLVKNAETGKMEASTEIIPFDENLARYDTAINRELAVKVTADDCKPVNEGGLADKDGWVTVNFVVQAGSDTKNYRLELWSGARDETGVTAEEAKGAVAFDVSQHTVNNVETLLKQYENEILIAYYNLIAGLDNATELFDEIKTENITSYEELVAKLVKDGKLEKDTVKEEYGFIADYYTFTLYDSEAYVPFNADTADDGATGYNYDPSLFNEKLAFFTFDDESHNSKNIFVDYTAVDQDITLNTDTDDGDDDDDEDTTTSTELGLYISSIVLVVVLLITLVSIGVTQFIKNKRKKNGAKAANKNAYRKRDRYIKKLHLVKNEEGEVESAEITQPADEQPAEQTTTEPEVTEEVTKDSESGEEVSSEGSNSEEKE